MKNTIFRQVTLSRYRHLFGFSVVAILAIMLVTYRFWAIPIGLSTTEIAAATEAGHLSPFGLVNEFSTSLNHLVNLPWSLVEWLSIHTFGATVFAMRLPAVVLMLLAGAALIAIFHKWTRANVALIAGTVTVSSAVFVGLARTGAGAAMAILLICLIILAASQLLQDEQTKWKNAAACATLSVETSILIYSTCGVYIVIGLLAAALIHPKTRLMIFQAKKWKILLLIVAGLIILSPLIVGLFLQITSGEATLIRKLLALDGEWSLENLQSLAAVFVGLGGGFAGGLVIPVFSIVGVIVAVLGLVRICVDFTSARSHLVLALWLTALILTISNPDFLYLLLVPFALSVCVGFDTLIRFWYGLFPFNPYARILALTLIMILVIGASWTNTVRYFDNNNYNTEIARQFSQEFTAARTEISLVDGKATLVVSPEQERFFEILQRDFPGLNIATEVDNDVSSQMTNLFILDSADGQINDIPARIITNSLSENSVLLRSY